MAPMRGFPAVLVVLSALAVAACNGGGQPAPTPTATPAPSPTTVPTAEPTATPLPAPSPPGPATPGPDGNVFRNGSFEEGRDPWFSLRPPEFTVSSDFAVSGEHSAKLQMRAKEQDEGTAIFYVIQEVLPEEFPEVISGHYRVTDWVRGTKLQYLQFAVIAFGAKNLPGDFSNHQIRYILSGIDVEPFAIANARFVFLSTKDPPLNEWVPFQVNVKQDFEKLWGDVPEFDKIRVLFEVRYDGKAAGGSPPEADAYYDDLFFGPAQ